jgi:hypothetical protein
MHRAGRRSDDAGPTGFLSAVSKLGGARGSRPITLRRGGFNVVPGLDYGTPKEIWGFRSEPGRGQPVSVARAFLEANGSLLGIDELVPELRKPRIVTSLAASHVMFQQRHRDLRVHRAYVTVHIGRDRRVYLVKNRAVPLDLLARTPPFRLTSVQAERRALQSVAARGRVLRVLGKVEPLWFPLRVRVHPAFRVRIHCDRPRREWIIYVDGETGQIRSKYDNLAQAQGRARVFDPNPVAKVGDWRSLVKDGRLVSPGATAYLSVRLSGLSTTGYLDGRRVTTRPTRRRCRRRDRRFLLPGSERGFDEVMAYFHVDRAIRYLERLGYRGRRAIFRAPFPIDAHGTAEDNSWYSPGLRRLTFGTGGVDDAQDAEVILHEFGHAIQDAICPDFGQSAEAAAMGEGFGDYLAATFFAAKKPPILRPCVASWDAMGASEPLDVGQTEPPALRRVDSTLTYESFDHRPQADEHVNGQIWSAVLWSIRGALGRRVADRLILESHFQLDGFTRFAKGARAILDADRNLFRGEHGTTLRRILARRGIGPLE